MNEKDVISIIVDFVDLLLPELTPYEASLYLFILRNSVIKNGSPKMRVGKRPMAQGYGTGKWGAKTSFKHMTKLLTSLEEKGCLLIGDTTREGTEYTIKLPREIPLIQKKLATIQPPQKEDDYFTDPQKRILIFERDNWICQYCGERVTKENSTLDHYIPQSKGGKGTKENLRTCCLVCNSIKLGKSYEEAAPHILKNIQERGKRKNK